MSESAAARKTRNAPRRWAQLSVSSSGATTSARTIRPSVMAFGRLRQAIRLAERLDDELADRFQRIEHADAAGRHRLEVGGVAGVQLPLQLVQGGDVGKVALVVLDHEGD